LTGSAKKNMLNAIKRGIHKQPRTDTPCAEVGSAAITAPKKNIWAPLTDVDAAAVAAWLFSQSDLNLTVSANATSWDNSM
jgi:primary-amine oxidase